MFYTQRDLPDSRVRLPRAGGRAWAWFALSSLFGCSGSESGPTAPEPPQAGPAPVIASVAPNTLVEGASVVVSGSNFAPGRSSNVVTIDGVEAAVTTATTTQLTVVVPTFDCRPQRMAAVRVRVGIQTSNSVEAPVTPASFLESAVGQMLRIDDPSAFCLQFAPAEVGAGEYLIGVGSAAERPDELFAVSMSAVTGDPAPASASVSASRAETVAVPPASGPSLEAMGRWRRHAVAEQRLRRWEGMLLGTPLSRTVPTMARERPLRSVEPSRAVPSVGDVLSINLPTWGANTFEGACAPTTISTVVRVVGQRGIFVTDVANPTADPLTDAEIQSFSDAFDGLIYDTLAEYFGTPTDLDGNQRIVVVLTVELNKALGGQIGGAVTFLNLVDPSECPASNFGELYYAHVPDPDNEAGTLPREKSDVTESFLRALAHEYTHIIQFSSRFPTGAPPAAWELEGQATLAIEVVGHAALGLEPGQDYDAAIALSGAGRVWYEGFLVSLATYYGHDPDGPKRPDAPDACTLLFVDVLAPTGCLPDSSYGAAWSFFRYLADRYGPSWPGGEAGLMRDWITLHPGLSGTANAEAILGRSFDEIFAEWAAVHYLDGRVGADPALLLSSWDLEDIMLALGADAALVPAARDFVGFQETLSIRGGSTAYSLFSDVNPRPATALKFRDAGGGALGPDMRPQIWVVRTR